MVAAKKDPIEARGGRQLVVLTDWDHWSGEKSFPELVPQRIVLLVLTLVTLSYSCAIGLQIDLRRPSFFPQK